MNRRTKAAMVVLSLLVAGTLVWMLRPGPRGAPSPVERVWAGATEGPGIFRSGNGGGPGDAGPGGAARAAGDAGWAGPLGAWTSTATVSRDRESPFGTLAGRVVSRRDGQPIAQAELLFDRDGATVSARSGPDGRFQLVATERGSHRLAIASAPGFLSYAPEWGHSPIAFTAEPEQRIDGVEIALEPELEVTVEVVDPTDGPVANAEVSLIGGGSRERALTPADDVYRTDEAGLAVVHAWDRALVEARRAGVRGRARIRGTEARIVLSELAGPSAGAIEGRVLGPSDSPIEGAVVQAYVPRRGHHASGQAVSDEGGHFRIEGLDPSPHVLVATHPHHPRAQQYRVAVGQADVVLRMPAGLEITGRVVDSSGAPVPAFTVVARRARGLRRTTDATVSSYDSNGRFVVTGLTEEASYELTASARGMPPSEPVQVSPGGNVTLTLEAGGRLEGTVRDAEGVGIEGAEIELAGYLGRGASAAPLEVRTRTDRGGRFVVDGIGAQPRSIQVRAEGFHARMLSSLTLAAGETRRIDVTLDPVAEGERTRTELAGIGAILRPGTDFLLVLRVVDGGGAQQAGLQRGDRIWSVDGVPVTQLGFGGSLERIRGEVGTAVRLEVQSRGEESRRMLTITRATVRT